VNFNALTAGKINHSHRYQLINLWRSTCYPSNSILTAMNDLANPLFIRAGVTKNARQ